MSELLYKPANSLVLQSYHARERSEPLNGDGFGIGWYAPDVTDTPGTLVSLTPAWSNQNLRSVAEHVMTPCFFGHIRAASPGMRVSEANCHPFRYGRYLWMHNGNVGGFSKLRRRLRGSLPDTLCDAIEGTTDTEHAFMLFLTLLAPGPDTGANEMVSAMTATVARLESLRAEASVDEPSYLNFAVTDGRSLVATRYASDRSREPITLYFPAGTRVVTEGERPRLVCACEAECSVIVASERLSDVAEDWARVAPNHLIQVTSDRAVTTRPLVE
jgi:glutamine amidotransferase